MMKMYVIETSKMQEICQQKTGIAEQQLCLKLFSEVHGQIQMKEHDFQSIWKIITQDHPRRYISKKVHDQKKDKAPPSIICLKEKGNGQKPAQGQE